MRRISVLSGLFAAALENESKAKAVKAHRFAVQPVAGPQTGAAA